MEVTGRFYSKADLARMADVPHPTLSRHMREGRFEGPRIPVGRRLIYDQAAAEDVLAYYRAWKPWIRDDDTDGAPTPSAEVATEDLSQAR